MRVGGCRHSVVTRSEEDLSAAGQGPSIARRSTLKKQSESGLSSGSLITRPRPFSCHERRGRTAATRSSQFVPTPHHRITHATLAMIDRKALYVGRDLHGSSQELSNPISPADVASRHSPFHFAALLQRASSTCKADPTRRQYLRQRLHTMTLRSGGLTSLFSCKA